MHLSLKPIHSQANQYLLMNFITFLSHLQSNSSREIYFGPSVSTNLGTEKAHTKTVRESFVLHNTINEG